ncbi:PucR family transcriptional regulator [Paenibacillus psychroresistens]|nr:PucR family transcriptional regulator [Paenibacillus psychroresistens]
MNITIEEALTIYPLSEGKLVAGAQGASRVISSLNLMDAPDIANWMKEGELLLTTGYAIKDSPDQFVKLLQSLNDRQSSGLGIKLGRYWKEIPQLVLDEANRLHFPLIELPFEFTFSEQITALFQSQFERNTKKLNDVLEMQKKLVDFAMQADEHTNYFDKISNILKHPIAVIGTNGKLLYNVSDIAEAELLNQWPWNLDYKLSRLNNRFSYRIPLLKNGICHGFFIVMPTNLADINAEEGIFHQAAVILSFHLESIQNQESTIASYRLGNTIERYFQGKTSLVDVYSQAKSIGSHTWSSSYVCSLSTFSSTLTDNEAKKSFIRSIQRELLDYPKLAAIESYHFFVFDKLVSLFAITENETKEMGYMEQISESFAKLLNTLSVEALKMYVSKIKRSAEELMSGYEECLEAQRINATLTSDSSVIFFADLEFIYLLRHIPQEVMSSYCDYFLYPLLQKDEDYITEMLRTLEAYFASNGQINDAAKELYIHRNTVLYRLEKIGEILHIDLKNTNHLLQLKLVLMFKRLLVITNQ